MSIGVFQNWKKKEKEMVNIHMPLRNTSVTIRKTQTKALPGEATQ
jgi:hypothetical protein